MTELEMLAAEIGVSERTLRRAANDGALRVDRPTPRKWRVSAEEKQWVRRAWPLLSRLRATLRTEPNVRFALLFGSTARGEDSDRSDVDILVEMLDDSLGRVAELELKLEAALGRRVDLVTLSAAESNPLLLATAAVEGRVLVDRDELWPQLSEKAVAFKRRARQQSRQRTSRALAGIDRLLAE